MHSLLVMDRMASAARAGEHAQREQDESHRANRSSAMHNESVRDARAAQQSAEHAMAWMNHNRSHLPSLPPAQLPPPSHATTPRATPSRPKHEQRPSALRGSRTSKPEGFNGRPRGRRATIEPPFVLINSYLGHHENDCFWRRIGYF